MEKYDDLYNYYERRAENIKKLPCCLHLTKYEFREQFFYSLIYILPVLTQLNFSDALFCVLQLSHFCALTFLWE